MDRDSNIDALRGLMMLYVIFIIHGLCWFCFVPINSIFFSLLLFEMPIIFYNSGAALKLSKAKPFKLHLKSRVMRVVIPYLMWAIITAFVLFVVGDIKSDWKNLVLCRSLTSIPYVWHIWFIYPYLIISLMGFFLLKAFHRYRNVFLITYSCSVILIITILDTVKALTTPDIIRYILVYSFFFVYGFTYKETYNNTHTLCFVLFLVLYLFLIIAHLYPYSTQINKFPPNLAFLCYGGIVVTALSLFMMRTKLYGGGILSFANKYGFELYLYQNYAIWTYAIIQKKFLLGFPTILRYLLCIICVACILFPLAYLMNKVNNKIYYLINLKNEQNT